MDTDYTDKTKSSRIIPFALICVYLCESVAASVWLFGFQLLNYRPYRGGLRSVRREAKIVLVSRNRLFCVAALFVSRAQQLINDWFSVGQLIHRNLKLARGELVLTFFFIGPA